MGKIIKFNDWKKRNKSIKMPKPLTITKEKERPKLIEITDTTFPDIPLSKKSCGTCEHYKSTPSRSVCMQAPESDFFHLSTKICTPYDRKFWHPKSKSFKFTFEKLITVIMVTLVLTYLSVSVVKIL